MGDKSALHRTVKARLQAVAHATDTLKALAAETHDQVLNIQTLERNWKQFAQLDIEFASWFMAAMPADMLADALFKVTPARFDLIKQVISWAEKKREDESE